MKGGYAIISSRDFHERFEQERPEEIGRLIAHGAGL
jgi:hypothetical protein